MAEPEAVRTLISRIRRLLDGRPQVSRPKINLLSLRLAGAFLPAGGVTGTDGGAAANLSAPKPQLLKSQDLNHRETPRLGFGMRGSGPSDRYAAPDVRKWLAGRHRGRRFSRLGFMQESRAAERVEIDTAIYILWGTDESLRGGKITSLSVKGCFVQTRSEAAVGQTISIRIRLPTERWMLLEGRVKRVLRRVGFGVEFTRLAQNDAGMLDLLVEYFGGDSQVVSGVLCEEDGASRSVQRIKGGRVLVGPI